MGGHRVAQSGSGGRCETTTLSDNIVLCPTSSTFPSKEIFRCNIRNTKLPSPAHGDWVDWQALSAERRPARAPSSAERRSPPLRPNRLLRPHRTPGQSDSPLIHDFKARSEKAGRPWIIVFTSDHGEMLGDHGYFRKCEPYEGSANIPFIISGSPSLGFKLVYVLPSRSAWKISCPRCLHWLERKARPTLTVSTCAYTARAETDDS